MNRPLFSGGTLGSARATRALDAMTEEFKRIDAQEAERAHVLELRRFADQQVDRYLRKVDVTP